MAGFVDGEGQVTITRQARKNRPSPAYRAYVVVTNTKREVLLTFPEHHGGKIYRTSEQRRDWKGKKWADAYAWYCPMAGSRRFLMDLLPFLKLKGVQARIVLAFIDNKKAFARGKRVGRGGSSPLTGQEIAFRERLRTQVMVLNSKGKFARSQGGG